MIKIYNFTNYEYDLLRHIEAGTLASYRRDIGLNIDQRKRYAEAIRDFLRKGYITQPDPNLPVYCVCENITYLCKTKP